MWLILENHFSFTYFSFFTYFINDYARGYGLHKICQIFEKWCNRPMKFQMLLSKSLDIISFSLIKVLRNETFIFTSIHQNSVKQCSTQPSKEQECDWILCKGIIVFIYQFIIVPAKKKLNFKIKLLGLLLAKISSCTYTVRIFQFYQETFSSVIDFHELLLIYSAMT